MHRITVALKSASDNVYTDKYTVLIGILGRPVRPLLGENASVGVEL